MIFLTASVTGIKSQPADTWGHRTGEQYKE